MAEEQPAVTVVVPTYNERDNLAELVERIHRSLSSSGLGYEVLVVDDDSPDGTWRLAEQLAERYPVRVIRRVGRRGLGSAIVEGLRSARGRYVAVIDADLQHPPELLPRLVEEAERRGADIVVATRYAEGGGVEGWSRLRLLVSRAAGLLAHLLLPEARKTSDPMSGYWLVRRSLLEGVELRGDSWKVLLELLVRARGARVAEVPYVFRERRRGESKLGPGAMAGYVASLLRLSGYRVAKFAAVGATGAAVNLAAAAALRGHVPDVAAYAAGWEAGLTWNYLLHDAWTFRGRRRERGLRGGLRYWARYHRAAAAGFAAYIAVAYAARLMGAGYLAAPLLGILAGFAANYLISEHHVWPSQGD